MPGKDINSDLLYTPAIDLLSHDILEYDDPVYLKHSPIPGIILSHILYNTLVVMSLLDNPVPPDVKIIFGFHRLV